MATVVGDTFLSIFGDTFLVNFLHDLNRYFLKLIKPFAEPGRKRSLSFKFRFAGPSTPTLGNAGFYVLIVC